MQNPREINHKDRRRLKITGKTQVPTSLGKNQYLSSFFDPRISVQLSVFQTDFHKLQYPYCNLNLTDQNKNQSLLTLLKTTKQKESC